MTRLWFLVAVLITLAAPFDVAQQPESSLPIEIAVPTAPIPVRGAGATHLFYELHLTNFRNAPLELTRVDVLSGDDTSRVLASYSGQEITSRLLQIGRAHV